MQALKRRLLVGFLFFYIIFINIGLFVLIYRTKMSGWSLKNKLSALNIERNIPAREEGNSASVRVRAGTLSGIGNFGGFTRSLSRSEDSPRECKPVNGSIIVLVPFSNRQFYQGKSKTKMLEFFTQLSKVTRATLVNFIMVFSVDSFSEIHREWCKTLGNCEISVTETLKISNLIGHIQSKNFCVDHYLLLGDNFMVDFTFLKRLQGVEPSKVQCLLDATGGCPALAYSVPSDFQIKFESKSIALDAAQQHRYGNNLPVVALANT